MTAPRAFIPQPLPGMTEYLKLLGQPTLRASVLVTDQGGGVARVTAQVRNCVGQSCTGVYRVHIFAASSAGGATVDQADAITNERGLVTVDLTAGAGTRYFHAAVLGIYDVAEKVVT